MAVRDIRTLSEKEILVAILRNAEKRKELLETFCGQVQDLLKSYKRRGDVEENYNQLKALITLQASLLSSLQQRVKDSHVNISSISPLQTFYFIKFLIEIRNKNPGNFPLLDQDAFENMTEGNYDEYIKLLEADDEASALKTLGRLNTELKGFIEKESSEEEIKNLVGRIRGVGKYQESLLSQIERPKTFFVNMRKEGEELKGIKTLSGKYREAQSKNGDNSKVLKELSEVERPACLELGHLVLNILARNKTSKFIMDNIPHLSRARV